MRPRRFIALLACVMAAFASVGVAAAGGAAEPLTPDTAERPEPMAFLFMRRLAAAPAGPLLASYRNQIDNWQAFAHDRRRRVGPEWLTPEEFIRRRKAFQRHLREANELLHQAQRLRGTTADVLAEQKRLKAQAVVKMRQAAKAWADPVIQKFLLGLTELQAGKFAEAEQLFRQCRSASPRVAAFYQGQAEALVGLNRGMDALEASLALLRLRPDAMDAVELLEKAMQAVPGYQIKTPQFRTAQEMLKQYERPGRPGSYGPRGKTWLMPGKAWLVPDDALPVPPYDRLTFLQAPAVPIGKQTLLVDRSVVQDALEILVQIDEHKFAIGSYRPSSISRADAEPPVAAIAVPDYTFTPLGAGEETQFAAGESATAFGLSMFEEMGTQVRRIPARIQSVTDAGEARLSAKLSAGEAAAPVVTDGGELVGFLAGKTNVLEHDGGPDRLIQRGQLKELIRRGARSRSWYSSYRSYPSVKRKTEPKPAQGKFFVVHAILAETFGE